MGSPVRSAEILDAEVIEETKEIVNPPKPGPVEDGLSPEDMAKVAQHSIIQNEQAMQPIRLPGNRKARRNLQKQIKIPKSSIMKCTKKQADEYTRSFKENVISMTYELKKKKVEEEVKNA